MLRGLKSLNKGICKLVLCLFLAHLKACVAVPLERIEVLQSGESSDNIIVIPQGAYILLHPVENVISHQGCRLFLGQGNFIDRSVGADSRW